MFPAFVQQLSALLSFPLLLPLHNIPCYLRRYSNDDGASPLPPSLGAILFCCTNSSPAAGTFKDQEMTLLFGCDLHTTCPLQPMSAGWQNDKEIFSPSTVVLTQHFRLSSLHLVKLFFLRAQKIWQALATYNHRRRRRLRSEMHLLHLGDVHYTYMYNNGTHVLWESIHKSKKGQGGDIHKQHLKLLPRCAVAGIHLLFYFDSRLLCFSVSCFFPQLKTTLTMMMVALDGVRVSSGVEAMGLH